MKDVFQAGLSLLAAGGWFLLWNWSELRNHLAPCKYEAPSKPYAPLYSVPPSKREKESVVLLTPSQARVAILIDDMGSNPQVTHSLLNIDAPLSFAILPFLPYFRSIAHWAKERQRDVHLHLPLEPRGYPRVELGEGAVFKNMEEDVQEERLFRNLKAVPHIIGVNNHMGGSRFTEAEKVMRIILEILNGVFFSWIVGPAGILSPMF